MSYPKITCTPRTIPPGEMVSAARTAVAINPRNEPALAGLAEAIPGFMPPAPEELAVVTQKYWGADGVRLTVSFLDAPSRELKDKILSHMNAWNEKANVSFVETADLDTADVRINRERMNDPQWNGYWSFLGTDIKVFSGPNNQTMNLEAFTINTPEAEFFRVVRHETGHTMGFPHEHMRQELVEKIDRQKAIDFYRQLTGWTEQQVIRQVLTPLGSDAIVGTAIADPNSIMAYQVPGSITIDGEPIIGGSDIVTSDHEFAALIYPKIVH